MEDYIEGLEGGGGISKLSQGENATKVVIKTFEPSRDKANKSV